MGRNCQVGKRCNGRFRWNLYYQVTMVLVGFLYTSNALRGNL
nr:MAG TPA: hypothetical protein [Caudoviricetes sp.]